MNRPAGVFSCASRSPAAGGAAAARRQACRLGVAGLVPFLVLSALHVSQSGELRQAAGQALLAYGAVIVSFLGAVHWGAALATAGHAAVTTRLWFAVTPALLGWIAMLSPLFYGLLLVIATLLLTWYADRQWFSGHEWYPVLRKRLTIVATLCLAVAAVSALKEV